MEGIMLGEVSQTEGNTLHVVANGKISFSFMAE